MKWLIALLLTCSSVLGQGFGSFSYDQPFLASTTASSPSVATNLIFDFDGDKGVWADLSLTVPATNGNTIEVWSNQGTNAVPTVFRNVGTPIYRTNNGTLNGHGYVALNGASELVAWNTPVQFKNRSSLPVTYVIVCRGNSATPGQGIYFAYISGGGDGQTGLKYGFSANVLSTFSGSDITATVSQFVGNWTIVTSVFNGANSYMRTNGVLAVAGNAGTYTKMGDPSIGNVYAGGNRFNGDIARILIWTRELGTNEMISTEQYLKTLYGVTP